jgi:hypothetical protein
MNSLEHLDLTGSEKDLLAELLASAERELLTEIAHTDTRDYREKLEERLATLQQLRCKII